MKLLQIKPPLPPSNQRPLSLFTAAVFFCVSSMDTFTSSVSTLRVPAALHSSSREFFHFKNTAHLPHLPSSSRRSNSISKPTNSLTTHKPLQPLPYSHSPSSSPRRSSSPALHRRPATGYAAALVEVAQSSGSLHSVGHDVGRFSKLLRTKQIGGVLNDRLVGEEEKGRVVREVAVKGGFHRQLVRLMKMLIEKNKVGILKEVLSEFERIYDELCGTEVVFVSSSRKMEEEQLFGIAKKVQKLSGAAKVKVRSFVHGGLV